MSTERHARRTPAEAKKEATQRLRRLLAEFHLYGGFAGPNGMQVWGEVQRAVRDAEEADAATEEDEAGGEARGEARES